MASAVIVGAVRTPVGKYGGALKDVDPDLTFTESTADVTTETNRS